MNHYSLSGPVEALVTTHIKILIGFESPQFVARSTSLKLPQVNV